MRVSYVGNFAVDYSTESHIAKAWENLGHEVTRIPEQSLSWPDLPEKVEGSDLFLWTRTAGFDPPNKNVVQPEALSRIKVPKVGYHLDRWWGLDREWWIADSPFFTDTDFLCTADGGHQEAWASRGIKHYWFPPAILSDETELGTYDPQYECDVAFVGNLAHYGHIEWAPYRRELGRVLRKRYGERFRVFPEGRGAIRGRELANLYATVPVLIGDSCLAGGATRYWSDRIPETTGRGGFLVHPEVPGLLNRHPSLWVYPLGDFDRLFWLVDLALEEQTYLARWWGHRQRLDTLASHTYEKRMERLVSLL